LKYGRDVVVVRRCTIELTSFEEMNMGEVRFKRREFGCCVTGIWGVTGGAMEDGRVTKGGPFVTGL
jgi:hypothetical protein